MIELHKARGRTGKLYNLHLVYCKDKGLKPVKRSGFSVRTRKWNNEKRIVFTPSKGYGGNRQGDDCVMNLWKKEVNEGTCSVSYTSYLRAYHKKYGKIYKC